MNWGKQEQESPRHTSNQIQTQINITNDRKLNLVVPPKCNDSESDELELSDEDLQNETRTSQKVKYSDELFKMVGKIVYKEVILESKKADYDMFSYQVNPRSMIKQKQKAYVLSRTQLKKTEVPVDGKPIRVYDKLVYMSKTT